MIWRQDFHAGLTKQLSSIRIKNYTMAMEYNLGDKVILDGLKGYWEIVEVESLPDSAKRYVLRIKANKKYKRTDFVEFLCCELTLAKLASKLNHNPFC